MVRLSSAIAGVCDQGYLSPALLSAQDFRGQSQIARHSASACFFLSRLAAINSSAELIHHFSNQSQPSAAVPASHSLKNGPPSWRFGLCNRTGREERLALIDDAFQCFRIEPRQQLHQLNQIARSPDRLWLAHASGHSTNEVIARAHQPAQQVQRSVLVHHLCQFIQIQQCCCVLHGRIAQFCQQFFALVSYLRKHCYRLCHYPLRAPQATRCFGSVCSSCFTSICTSFRPSREPGRRYSSRFHLRCTSTPLCGVGCP